MSFCSELNSKLDEIIALLNSQPSCCGTTTALPAPDVSLDGSGDVPQPVIDAGYAEDVDDWPAYRDYKCMAAHAFIDAIRHALDLMSEPIELGFLGYDVLTEIMQWAGIIAAGTITFGPITVSGLAIIALIAALKDPLLESMDAISQDVEDNRDDLACALVNADGILAISQAWDDTVDTLFSDAAALVLKNMNIDYLTETYFKGAYGDADAAQAMADAGYDPADYTCCEQQLETIGRFLDPTWCEEYTAGDPIPLGTYIRVNSISHPTETVQVIRLMCCNTESGAPDDEWDFDISDIDGWSDPTTYPVANNVYIYENQSSPPYFGSPSYAYPSPTIFSVPYQLYGHNGFIIWSETAFSINIKLTFPTSL